MLFANANWEQVEALRKHIALFPTSSLHVASQSFASLFVDQLESVVLARVFLVKPFESLSRAEQTFAESVAKKDPGLGPKTPVLVMQGTRGREADWNDRTLSQGHLAIPLIDQRFVAGAPMLAQLLADLEVDLEKLGDGRPIATRRMLGGSNATFYVRDAATAVDSLQRSIIPDQRFVSRMGVRTVFGMGGAYYDGTLVVAIVFTTELLERDVVDRYPSFISNFKMATSELLVPSPGT